MSATESRDGSSAASLPLVFSCSGAADVGEIADSSARRLSRDGTGRMYCLAGVGGRVGDIMANTQAAGQILAIDGCPLECARNTLEQAGFTRFEHVRLSDLGLKKGESPVSDERIAQVVEWAEERIGH